MSIEESERITTSQDVISRLHDKIDEQQARIAEMESELEAVGAGGVEPLRKDMVPLSDVLERLAQGFGRESAPVTTIRSHFAKNAAQAKQGEQANG